MPSAQGILDLFRAAKSARDVAHRASHVGRGGELYLFPKELAISERKPVTEAYRDMLEDGLVAPASLLNGPKAEDTLRLANTIISDGLPKQARGMMLPAWHDAVAVLPDATGRYANAAAMFDSPLSLRNRDYFFLQDLVGSPDAPGSGEKLLRHVLGGDLYDDASHVLLTPLPRAKDFYTKKFGMRWLSPDEAAGDPAIDSMLGGANARHNAEDLGVGIINRAQGGLAALRRR